MPSSGGQFWGWCPSCKIREQPPPGMSRRHPSSSCGVGAHTRGWSRYAPPHPFKVKLGDHFSAAPEITPGWGLAPGCGTHGTPFRCRSELVGLPLQYTTISATMKRSAVPRPRPSCNSRRQILQETADAREQTLWPCTQTLAAVLLHIGASGSRKRKHPKRNHQRSTAWARPSPGGASVSNLSEGV